MQTILVPYSTKPCWAIHFTRETKDILKNCNQEQRKAIKERFSETLPYHSQWKKVKKDSFQWIKNDEKYPPIAPINPRSCAIFMRTQTATKTVAVLHRVRREPERFQETLRILANTTTQTVEIFFLNGQRFAEKRLAKLGAILKSFEEQHPKQFVLKEHVSYSFITNTELTKNLIIMAGADPINAQPIAILSKRTKKDSANQETK